MIDPAILLAETFVRKVLWTEQTGSTNSDALRIAAASDELPLLIGTEHQTAGRGRGTNIWWSDAGGLTFSLLLEPAQYGLTGEHWPRLSLCTGLAVCTAISELLPETSVQLKWPNDVYADGKKLCGILLEGVPTDAGQLVIGVGLNVNNLQTAEGTLTATAPNEFLSMATSLARLTGREYDRTTVLVELLKQLEITIQLLAQDRPELPQQWQARCFLQGRMVTLSDASGEVTGYCAGIDDDGALRILTAHGPQRFVSGTVRPVEESASS